MDILIILTRMRRLIIKSNEKKTNSQFWQAIRIVIWKKKAVKKIGFAKKCTVKENSKASYTPTLALSFLFLTVCINKGAFILHLSIKISFFFFFFGLSFCVWIYLYVFQYFFLQYFSFTFFSCVYYVCFPFLYFTFFFSLSFIFCWLYARHRHTLHSYYQ